MNLVIVFFVYEHDLKRPKSRDVQARWFLNQLSAYDICGVLVAVIVFMLIALITRFLVTDAGLLSVGWGSHADPCWCSVSVLRSREMVRSVSSVSIRSRRALNRFHLGVCTCT